MSATCSHIHHLLLLTRHHLADHHHDETNSPKHRDTLKSFLDNDRKVLRFYCSWDDRESLYGEVRDFVSQTRLKESFSNHS